MSFITTIKSLFGFSSKGTSMSPGDRMLSCMDCDGNFVFDSGEQRFFKEKGFTDPKRCPHCRKKVRFRMKKKSRGGKFRGRMFSKKHSVIDGDSPYADER
jgi:hypothetical protein